MTRRRVLALAVAGAHLVFAAATTLARAEGTMTDFPVLTGGEVRTARLYKPDSLPTARAVPLVLALHGLANTPDHVANDSGLNDVADREQFVVAYPVGIGKSWNAGRCCGGASRDGVDDVAYLADLIAQVSLTTLIDRDRVFVAGFSNGGMMALRFACERPDLVAAVASVSGTMQTECTATAPVSVLQITGERDGLVPYRGAVYSDMLKTNLTTVPSTVGTWERLNGCSGLPARYPVGTSQVRSYTGCSGRSAVRLVLVSGAGHRWPTADQVGYDATEAVWSFFRTHPADDATPVLPELTTRILATRDRHGVVTGTLDGRFDVVIGSRLVVDVKRGGRWVAVGSAATDFEGRFLFRPPGGPLRIRYEGPGLPSSARIG